MHKTNIVIYITGILSYTYIYQHMESLREYADVITPLWFALFVSAVFFLSASIMHWMRLTKRRRYTGSTLAQIDAMTGEEFEKFLKACFEEKGYRVTLTPASNDYGADLVCKKEGRITVVQAKRYKGKVGNKAIQEIVAAKGYYDADKCMVITNSYFTKNARELAKSNAVILLDRSNVETIKGRKEFYK